MTETEKMGGNPKKCIFAVINLADARNEQKSVAEYAARLSHHLGMELVLYPKNDDTKLSFKKAYISALKVAEDVSELTPVRVSKHQRNKFSFFSDIPSIAAEENAMYIIMQIDESARFWSESMWKTTQKSVTPIILLPKFFTFVPFAYITIGIDAERKVQKVNLVKKLAKKFNASIKIFVENPELDEKAALINNIMPHITNNLTKSKINFEVTIARKTTKFLTRLCKYSAKHADLLVIEIEQGKIEADIKKNIATLLQIKYYAKPIPVLLTKTQECGIVFYK